MRILVLSDSHRYLFNMREVITKLKTQTEHIIFLGDGYHDIKMMESEFPSHNFYTVRGNNDGYASHLPPRENLIELSGKKILLTHGNEFFVDSGTWDIISEAEKKEADICLYGHTHYPAIFYNSGILFLNPGSISFPRRSAIPSYGILEIEEDGINAVIVGKYKYGYSPMEV